MNSVLIWIVEHLDALLVWGAVVCFLIVVTLWFQGACDEYDAKNGGKE